jgi:uncharacterized 2Fe-2S/4Fe-4S cluster protein (DUF4445 family)
VFITKARLAPPDAADRRACDQRIHDALGQEPLEIPLSVLRKIQVAALGGSAPLSFVICRLKDRRRVLDIGREKSYSIALDIGTTNLVALLYDNAGQRDVVTMSFENPQRAFGSDILTRMHHAMLPGGREVYRALRDGVNTALRTVCEQAGIATGDVHAAAVAGNTVMSHFFLGLDISTIPVEPFVPIVRSPGFVPASELGLDLHPEALVYIFPNAGSYVGGDIVAGILAAGIHRTEKPSILIDVGTNAEVVIGNREWMLVGAGAAGPALEEGISRIGKRADKGIIYDVEIKNGAISCETFDHCSPEGICGSGMVSLLHALFLSGIIDQTGTLNPGDPHVRIIDNEACYQIPCGAAEPLVIRETEIKNFIKSKAAMFTLLLVLVRAVGITFKDISRVCVSGALGNGIDADKAAGIGMLPSWPAEIIEPLGNTSLKGARMLLADGGLLETIDEVAAKITYKHMHDDPEFMKEFMGAVFIPHTNTELLKAEQRQAGTKDATKTLRREKKSKKRLAAKMRKKRKKSFLTNPQAGPKSNSYQPRMHE